MRQDGEDYVMVDEARALVTAKVLNLFEPWPLRQLYDVIFCRNVMIYFDDDMKQRVVGMFGDQIAKDGTLFIGHSENIRSVNNSFEGLQHAQGFCYRPLPKDSAKAA